MPYCTLSDILERIDEDRLIQLTDDEGTGAVSETRVATAIADADGLIDGYVGTRHAVPLDPVPAIIKTYSAVIAIYNLFGRRDRVPDSRAQDYKDAVRFLELVAAGKISLGRDDPEGSPPTTDAPKIESDRTFTRSTLAGF